MYRTSLATFLPWIVGLIACIALYSGIDAIWSAEYCSRGRSGPSCSHGVRAQLEGGTTIAFAILIALVPAPKNRIKTVLFILVSAAAGCLLVASLLVK